MTPSIGIKINSLRLFSIAGITVADRFDSGPMLWRCECSFAALGVKFKVASKWRNFFLLTH
ncbi:MAG: hypothetical protein ABS22_08900 [SAR92 bacterium BACL16 MAG-120322-bin99]|nr:MAG: hypothetical protein ABS23_01640 [SAR92 bacterium BACL16 MAG-120619-bin48]KRP22354.1 MAG: hypothetical protein ABS22_08900 [SAR92 bacterium BACL16 MAG-120322-bin99]HAU02476.1 hypothetical protein [Porticoccaceae bacterium]